MCVCGGGGGGGGEGGRGGEGGEGGEGGGEATASLKVGTNCQTTALVFWCCPPLTFL